MKKKPETNFTEALASARARTHVRRGRRTTLEKVEKVLGAQFAEFLGACLDDKTSGKALHRALLAIGIKCSYLTVLRMRETIEEQYGWYGEMVANDERELNHKAGSLRIR